ncbi:MAG: flavin reductase family protein [Oscillospiraceae bacterium]|nr:flavin reductase family protein [Oscillospiraceae bacterium]
MKKIIDAFDYAGDICKAMKKGILLTTKANGQVNTMTIGWGTMGVEWGRPIFVAYVRGSRYTHQMIENSGEFTVNVPVGDFDSKILGICGTKSGRDMDKIKELNLTLEEPLNCGVPGIKELPLTLECKVLYRMEQTLDTIPQDILDRYYPDGDFHYAYYAEIVGAYIVE